MRKILILMMSVLFVVVISGCTSDSSDNDEEGSDKESKIVLGETNWTSTIPPTKIVEMIFEDMGYEVEVQKADIGAVYTAVSTGEVDVFMDSWYPQQKEYLDEYDTIEQLSPTFEGADAGMTVPTYMEDINDVEDLIGKEDTVNNEIIAVEDGDPAMDELRELADAYDLDIEVINSSEGAMISHAKAQIEKKEPVIIYGWEPHSMFNDLELKILTNKKHSEYFDGSSVNPVVYEDFKEDASEAYDFLDNLKISIDEMTEMITRIDNDESPDVVAEEWIDSHQAEIEEWKKD